MSNFPGSILLNEKNIRAQTVGQIHPLGTRGYTRDGRSFRYAQAAAAITGGRLCQARAVSSWSINENFKSTYAAGTTKIVMQIVSTGAPSSEDSTGYFNDGFFLVNNGTGEGQLTQIDTMRTWTTATTAGLVSTIYLYDDGLKANVSTGTECGVVINKYKRVVMHPKAQTAVPVGIAPIDVTISYYFWLQTWGYAAVMMGGTTIAGRAAYPDIGTNTGYVRTASSDWGVKGSSFTSEPGLQYSGLAAVGNIQEVSESGEYGIIDLHLAP